MNGIFSYAIMVIPVVIGVISGINKKLDLKGKLSKEIVTVITSIFAVLYDFFFLDHNLDFTRAIMLFVVIYFGASGIYDFIPRALSSNNDNGSKDLELYKNREEG